MARRRATTPRRPAAEVTTPADTLGARASALLFLAALTARVLFWQATPDRAWPHNAHYKGDALLWLDYATALRRGNEFELGLPIHPPGTAYLVSWLWDGSMAGLAVVKLAWCLMGALTVVLAALAAARVFGRDTGMLCGALLVGWTPLLILSTSIGAETPYLVLAVATVWRSSAVTGPSRGAAAWGALNGLACLFRVEHALFTAAALALALFRRPAAVRGGLVATAAFVVVLVPWHLHAWRATARFNTEAVPLPDGHPVRQLGQRLAGVPWEPDAERLREAWPAFSRETAATFVAATVLHRGGSRVRGEDVGVLDEAFGARPTPLGTRPFVSAYGPLNFALSWHPEAGVGFSTAALDAPPPLRAARDSFPPYLVQGLPPPQLALTYPPHLALFNDGYAYGWRWIRRAPRAALSRVGGRLDRFWTGATTGVTGLALPGGAGLRPAVDVAVPAGAGGRAWSLVVLAAAATGAALARERGLPWLLFAATKMITAALFFGYARLGAVCSFVVALFVAVALEHVLRTRRPALPAARVAVVVAAVLLVVEVGRTVSSPTVRLDGRPIGPMDHLPADDHREHRLE